MVQSILDFYSAPLYFNISAILMIITIVIVGLLFYDVNVMEYSAEIPWGITTFSAIVAFILPYGLYSLFANYLPHRFQSAVIVQSHKSILYYSLKWISTYHGGLIFFGVVGFILIALMGFATMASYDTDVSWSLDNAEKMSFSWFRFILTAGCLLIFNGYLNYYFNRSMAMSLTFAALAISIALTLIGYNLTYHQTMKRHND